MITVRELREKLKDIPDNHIIYTTDRFDTDGLPVPAATCGTGMGKAIGKFFIESPWEDGD